MEKMNLFLLKSVLRILFNKFGLIAINDKLAEILNEEAKITSNYDYDELSQSYDNINYVITMKKYKDK